MDEKDIEIFRSLIKTGNVTKSSEKLYTTQSSLTKRIQKMEEELGCQLFIRTKKGVLPTPAAEKILPDFNLKLNLARGFRAPNISELSSNGVHEGTAEQLAENEIVREKYLGKDFVLRKKDL